MERAEEITQLTTFNHQYLHFSVKLHMYAECCLLNRPLHFCFIQRKNFLVQSLIQFEETNDLKFSNKLCEARFSLDSTRLSLAGDTTCCGNWLSSSFQIYLERFKLQSELTWLLFWTDGPDFGRNDSKFASSSQLSIRNMVRQLHCYCYWLMQRLFRR